jgi:hypothetical protein
LNPADSKAFLNNEVKSGSSSTNKILFFLLLDDKPDVTDWAISCLHTLL